MEKTFKYGDYQIAKADNGSISVLKNGEPQSNAKAALREIAIDVGLEVNPDWRTSQLGCNVIKAILLDATPAEIQQDRERTQRANNQIDRRYLYPISELYDGKNIKTDKLRPVPFLYRWWFIKTSKPMQLLEKYINANPYDIDMQHMKARLKSMCLNGQTYYALYFGKSINGRNRFSQHIRGNVDLSTLRKTICAVLLMLHEDASEESISKVLNDCYYEWVELEHDTELIDSFEMMAIAIGYYPLNLDGNSSISEPWKNAILDKRKELKDYK